MAGHSQFKNIMHRKGAQDQKRAQLFTKLVKEIIVSAKAGADPDANSRLRGAISTARANNLPKDRIENAIQKGSNPAGGDDFQEMRYEGFGPHGVAIIIEALTDNRNRSASDIRSAFTKSGGSLGETGCVSYQFSHVGLVEFHDLDKTADEVLEAAIEAGAESCESDGKFHEILCSIESLNEVRDYLSKKFGDPDVARLSWNPQNNIEVNKEQADAVMKLIGVLEDHDDVQFVCSNIELPENYEI